MATSGGGLAHVPNDISTFLLFQISFEGQVCLPPPAGQQLTHRGDQCRPQSMQGLQPLPTSQGIHPPNVLFYKWDHGRIRMTMEPQVPPRHLS